MGDISLVNSGLKLLLSLMSELATPAMSAIVENKSVVFINASSVPLRETPAPDIIIGTLTPPWYTDPLARLLLYSCTTCPDVPLSPIKIIIVFSLSCTAIEFRSRPISVSIASIIAK